MTMHVRDTTVIYIIACVTQHLSCGIRHLTCHTTKCVLRVVHVCGVCDSLAALADGRGQPAGQHNAQYLHERHADADANQDDRIAADALFQLRQASVLCVVVVASSWRRCARVHEHKQVNKVNKSLFGAPSNHHRSVVVRPHARSPDSTCAGTATHCGGNPSSPCRWCSAGSSSRAGSCCDCSPPSPPAH